MNSTPDTPLPPPSDDPGAPPPHDPGPPPSGGSGTPPPDAAPKRFERSSTDRVIGGVCGGLGRYFGIDPTLVRIGMVALALLGGTGLIVYAAALVLVPSDGEVPAGPTDTRDRALAVAVAITLTIVGFSLGLFGLGFGSGWGEAVFPLAMLSIAGLAVWWLVSGERPSGGPGAVVRRAALGAGLLIGCCALAVGSFFASGLGGAVVISSLVITAGAGLVAAAFVHRGRWLVLPALAIALPLAFVSAADIDLDGGFGEKRVRPGTLAEVKDGYRLGAGELVVDLRDVKLPAGDRRLKIDMGTGHALVLVADDVCVATTADVGMGAVSVFDRDNGGIDVEYSDARRAPAGTPRLVVDGDVGLGLLEVRHTENSWDDTHWNANNPSERNAACSIRTASKGSGASNG
jgi:phage shock protein PspC (stress-responsive transcriptional regulator)